MRTRDPRRRPYAAAGTSTRARLPCDSVAERSPIPLPRQDLLVEELSGEVVVLDPSTGDIHHLDRPASLVWGVLSACTAPPEVEHVVDTIVAAVDGPVDREVVAADVRGLLVRLRTAGLLGAG